MLKTLFQEATHLTRQSSTRASNKRSNTHTKIENPCTCIKM